MGASTVVVKNSGQKIYVLNNSNEIICDKITIINAIDTTGAGDSFNGSFLASLLSGIEIEECVYKAHNVALKVICEKGALIPMDKISKI